MDAVDSMVGLVPVAVAGGLAIGMTRAAMTMAEPQERVPRRPVRSRRAKARRRTRGDIVSAPRAPYMGWF